MRQIYNAIKSRGKSIYLIITVLSLGLACFSSCDNANQATNQGEAKIQFDSTEVDLGTLKRGDQVEYAFYFQNTGKGDLVIKDITTDCGCTVASIKKKEYKSGEKGVIRIKLNTIQLWNNQQKTTTVLTNAKDSITNLTLYAFVESDFELVETE